MFEMFRPSYSLIHFGSVCKSAENIFLALSWSHYWVSILYVTEYVSSKDSSWVSELEVLALFAVTQPHAAFAAFSCSLISEWPFIVRTVPNVSHLFKPLENCIHHQFIPSVTTRSPPGDLERNLFALPARIGGLVTPVCHPVSSLLPLKLLGPCSH